MMITSQREYRDQILEFRKSRPANRNDIGFTSPNVGEEISNKAFGQDKINSNLINDARAIRANRAREGYSPLNKELIEIDENVSEINKALYIKTINDYYCGNINRKSLENMLDAIGGDK